MAATGYTPISLYYSTTASAVPTAGNLANGELALNTADMKLYAKNSSGVVTLLASNAATTGVDSLSFGSTGLTPNTATTGAITVAGTLNVANGGTGQTSFTAGTVLYGNGTSGISASSNLFFDGTNSRLGIGTNSPSYRLDVRVTGTGNVANFQSDSGPNIRFTGTETSGRTYQVGEGLVTAGSFSIYDSTGSAERLVINSSGNLGLGVTPPSNSTTVGIFVNGENNLIGSTTNGASYGANIYRNSGVWKYTTSSTASLYQQFAGVHYWYTGASGTAGNAVSFTQAMTLFASGGFSLGGTGDPGNGGMSIVGTGYAYVNPRSASGYGSSINFTEAGVSDRYLVGCPASSNDLVFRSNAGSFSTGAERMRLTGGGGLAIGTTADPGAGAIYATGAITAYYSDERLKDVKGRIPDALAKVRRLSGVYYTNNETAKALGYTSDEMQVGVLAKQMKGELPEIVKPAPFDLDENGNSKSGENYMTVQYERGLPLLIEAIKELADQFDAYVATH